jgi:hypothetical protein
MKRVIKACDFFSVSQFTLYRTKEHYSTLTGGAASLLIIGMLMTILVQMSISTLNYATIKVDAQNLYDSDPTNYKLAFNPKQKFMFAIGIVTGFSYNMNLDIQLYNHSLIATNKTTKYLNNTIELQFCDISQWSGVSDEVTQAFYQFNL